MNSLYIALVVWALVTRVCSSLEGDVLWKVNETSIEDSRLVGCFQQGIPIKEGTMAGTNCIPLSSFCRSSNIPLAGSMEAKEYQMVSSPMLMLHCFKREENISAEAPL